MEESFADGKSWGRVRDPKRENADEPRPDFMRRLQGVLAPGSSLSRVALPGRARRGPDPPDEQFPTLAGFEILERLGRGATGVVYKARDLRLKRTVALKMLLAGGATGAEERASLRVEAEAVACLQHPNIVQIHEIAEQHGRPFLVLEFIEGGSPAVRLDGLGVPRLLVTGRPVPRQRHHLHLGREVPRRVLAAGHRDPRRRHRRQRRPTRPGRR